MNGYLRMAKEKNKELKINVITPPLSVGRRANFDLVNSSEGTHRNKKGAESSWDPPSHSVTWRTDEIPVPWLCVPTSRPVCLDLRLRRMRTKSQASEP